MVSLAFILFSTIPIVYPNKFIQYGSLQTPGQRESANLVIQGRGMVCSIMVNALPTALAPSLEFISVAPKPMSAMMSNDIIIYQVVDYGGLATQ